mgnify:CR=1 FL=1
MKGDKSIWDIIYVYCVIQYNIILIFLDIKISCHVQNKAFEYLPTELGNMQNTCINTGADPENFSRGGPTLILVIWLLFCGLILFDI